MSQRVVYECMKCGQRVDFTMIQNLRQVKCTACGSKLLRKVRSVRVKKVPAI